MKKQLIPILSSTFLGLFATQSQSADITPASAYDWSGAYVGLTAGYAWGNYEITASPATNKKQNMQGFLGGGTVGYNMQLDPIVLGLEADLSFADIGGSNATVPQGRPFLYRCGLGATKGCHSDIDWFGTARVRLGVPVDSMLPYITGGLAFADVDSGITGSAIGVKSIAYGWTVGGGVEAAMSENLTVKAEVLYVNLASLKQTYLGAEEKFDNDFTVARVGINYKF